MILTDLSRFCSGSDRDACIIMDACLCFLFLSQDLIPRFAELHQIYLGCLSVLDLE